MRVTGALSYLESQQVLTVTRNAQSQEERQQSCSLKDGIPMAVPLIIRYRPKYSRPIGEAPSHSYTHICNVTVYASKYDG